MRLPDPYRFIAIAAGMYIVAGAIIVLFAKALNGVLWG